MSILSSISKVASTYLVAGAAITLVGYPFLAEHVMLEDKAEEGDEDAKAKLDANKDKSSLCHLALRAFPYHFQLVTHMLKSSKEA